jgi:hypothetical protein
MAQEQISTIDAQELIYRRRVERFNITKGLTRGQQIDRVNASSDKKTKPRKIAKTYCP